MENSSFQALVLEFIINHLELGKLMRINSLFIVECQRTSRSFHIFREEKTKKKERSPLELKSIFRT